MRGTHQGPGLARPPTSAAETANAKSAADDRSEQRRNVTHAFAVIIVMVLALGGLMIWAAWL
jgi:hypothetical protein